MESFQTIAKKRVFSRVADPDPHGSALLWQAAWIRIIVKSWIRIRIKIKVQDLWKLTMEQRRAVDGHIGG